LQAFIDVSRRLRRIAAMVMAGAHQGRPYALTVNDINDCDINAMQTLSIVEGNAINA